MAAPVAIASGAATRCRANTCQSKRFTVPGPNLASRMRSTLMKDPGDRSPIKDPKRIDLDDPAEVAAWCGQLDLTPEDLRTAVETIGPMSAAVAVYVNSRGRRGASRQVGEIGHPFDRRGDGAFGDETPSPE
jgi:hypothetical protein